MTNDEHHVALPKLYGAPAYARPPRPIIEVTPRPLDEDDLPLEAFRSAEDEPPGPPASGEGAAAGAARGNGHDDDPGGPGIQARPFSMRALSRIIPGR